MLPDGLRACGGVLSCRRGSCSAIRSPRPASRPARPVQRVLIPPSEQQPRQSPTESPTESPIVSPTVRRAAATATAAVYTWLGGDGRHAAAPTAGAPAGRWPCCAAALGRGWWGRRLGIQPAHTRNRHRGARAWPKRRRWYRQRHWHRHQQLRWWQQRQLRWWQRRRRLNRLASPTECDSHCDGLHGRHTQH